MKSTKKQRQYTVGLTLATKRKLDRIHRATRVPYASLVDLWADAALLSLSSRPAASTAPLKHPLARSGEIRATHIRRGRPGELPAPAEDLTAGDAWQSSGAGEMGGAA